MCSRPRLTDASPTIAKNPVNTGHLLGLMILTRFKVAIASAPPAPSNTGMRSSTQLTPQVVQVSLQGRRRILRLIQQGPKAHIPVGSSQHLAL